VKLSVARYAFSMLLLAMLLSVSAKVQPESSPTTPPQTQHRKDAQLALRFTAPGPGSRSSTGTDAFQLTVTEQLTVTALCYFDHGGDWAGRQHPVALYRSRDQKVQASTRISQQDVPYGSFRCAQVEPVRLHPGETYQLAGYTRSTETWTHISEPVGLSAAQGLRYDGYLYSIGPDAISYLQRTPDPGDVFFGPNMLVSLSGASGAG
jgi:hypothetical protein